jgi:hypothetical protein
VNWNSEVFTAVALAVGLTTFAVRRWVAAGWPAVVLAVVNTPAAAVGLALAVGRRMVEDRRLRYGLALLAAAALIAAENWVRNGGPLRSGYEDNHGFATVMPYAGEPGFSYPFLFGLLSVCLSFGKGLLFFTPGLLLPIRRATNQTMLSDGHSLFRLYLWWIMVVVGLIVVYSPWWAWYGGLTWGPRFMLFASIPAALAIAVRLNDLVVPLWLRLFTFAVAAMSTWVGICGAVFVDAANLPVCSLNDYQYESLCHYTPDYSVLWYPFVRGISLSPVSSLVVGYFLFAFGWLVWPLCRSIAGDIGPAMRRVVPGLTNGWRW